MTDRPSPRRAEALDRLAACLPRLGTDYAAGRNTDPGPDQPGAVSGLSPYVRHRLLLEQELVAAALAAHGPQGARAFIRQVFWRSYWKGWLEGHPAVWTAYREDVRRGRDRLATEAGLRRLFHAATEGDTGIDCFDAWSRELVARNWLHNHARMWFASIWIFTLRLPWALGADFFARHLLDGDPASNTLSWRWVGGLHTPGKHYVARAENIRRYTAGRHDPRGALDEDPAPLTEPAPPPAPRLAPPAAPPQGTVALLLHIDDLLPEQLPAPADLRIRAIAALRPAASSVAHGTAERVSAFRDAALADAATRAGNAYGQPVTYLNEPELAAWAASTDCPVVALHVPVGPTMDSLPRDGFELHALRRAWDAQIWPHAQRGFFQLDKQIAELCRRLGF